MMDNLLNEQMNDWIELKKNIKSRCKGMNEWMNKWINELIKFKK